MQVHKNSAVSGNSEVYGGIHIRNDTKIHLRKDEENGRLVLKIGALTLFFMEDGDAEQLTARLAKYHGGVFLTAAEMKEAGPSA